MSHPLYSDNEQFTLRSLLQAYRDQAISEQEKQAAFEKFVIAYLTQDPLQKLMSILSMVDPLLNGLWGVNV
ncbi:hypothetical protein [Bartonella sp. CM120XJJH]|uniref:hypothetical protein n=1 Tax=Bartonella sp. CM120XJJH TaxID=3243544 RepID=UPI0035CFB8CE